MQARGFLLLSGVGLLVAVPYLLSQGLVNAAIQMLIAALFACAYNLLCGQAGMLSFGHAAYFGMGAFATVHAMNAAHGAGLLPTPLIPLAGGAGGLVFGLAAGYFATKRTGTYFAMITLAIAELVHSLAPHLEGVFGGEAGVSTTRMPAWGLSLASTNQVYYLTLAWVLVSLLLLYLLTRTPFGRLILGLRENGHRLRFLGYHTNRLSLLVFAVSAMFSGIAGGLQVVSAESANYVVFDPGLSAAVVLDTYIGGVGIFLGPALGAALMSFFGYAVSDITQSWLLYQGTLFVVVMLFMPSGLAGLIGRIDQLRHKVSAVSFIQLVLMGLAAAVFLCGGTVFLVELLQRLFAQDYRSLAAADPSAPLPAITLFGAAWLPGATSTWLMPAALLAAGTILAVAARRLAVARLSDPGTPAPATEPAALPGRPA